MTFRIGSNRIAGAAMRPAVAAVLVSALALAPAGPATAAAVFKTPAEAVDAFVAALNSEQGKGLVALFGAEHRDDLIGGDPAQIRSDIEALRRLAAESVTVQDDGTGRKEVVMGRNAWPMPIPLVEGSGGWSFDVAAGIEEISDRRIGRNELAVIETCRTYLAAQAAYASADRDGDRVLEYAQKLASTPGQRDGLYWEAPAGDEQSPLGPFVAQSEQYLQYRKEGEPFHGYYFRILAGQGANPPGGMYDYVINGNMIAGHALLAWPADYGNSGIMTFACSHHGDVLQKDLGAETAKIAQALAAYDVDDSWGPAQ